MAGTAAEQLFDSRGHRYTCLNDNLKIMKLLEGHGVSEEKYGRGLRAVAESWADSVLQKHRSKVARVANRLAECGRVEPAEFQQLMQDDA